MEYNDLVEATIEDLKKRQQDIVKLHPEFYSRVEAVFAKGGVRLVKMDEQGWLFNVKSVTQHDKKGTPVWYEVRVNFEGVPEVVAYYAKNRSLWKKDQTGLNVRDLAEEVLYNVDVKIKCGCPADLYWGGAYIRSQETTAAYPKPLEDRPPVERNPKQHGAFCKHIQAVINLLPMYGGTFAKWLKEYQNNHLGKIERDVRKEGSEVKDRAEEIQKEEPTEPQTEAERKAREKTSESVNESTLYGSSPTLEGIIKVISDFYMGSTVNLEPSGEGEWKVKTGRSINPLATVIVRLVKGRYRFEKVS